MAYVCVCENMPRRCCWLAFLLLLIATTCAEIRQLPYCQESATGKPSRSLLFVSTLDGKLTALDAAANGEKKWCLELQTEPLLSSNIHRRDLNNNGQWVRLIPSLNGGLYKFDGENLEAVPVSVDQLLQSSFRYSEDMIFSGGKETKTYGISSKTGQILYECKMSSCTNATDGESLVEEDILIVRRHQHTVRAGEPRSGIERWNFSVGQHDLTMLPRANSDCHQENLSINLDIEVRAIVPEGLVVAFSKNNPAIKLWEYKFDSPVVSVWREDQVFDSSATPLKQVNLFDSSQLDLELDSDFSASPGLYLGMHERQLYIQENPAFIKAIDQSKDAKLIKYPWRPYPAIEQNPQYFMNLIMTFLLKHTPEIYFNQRLCKLKRFYAFKEFAQDVGNDKNKDVPFEMNEVLSSTALSVLYNSEYINGNGFYLYSKEQIQIDEGSQCNGSVPKHVLTEISAESPPAIEYSEEDNIRVEFIIVGLWYYWREVAICCLTTGIIVWLYFKQMHTLDKMEQKDAVLPPVIVERCSIDTQDEIRKSTSEDGDSPFQSRYLTDYEPIDCLGRGGYGVVFEARNKIDDCNYAIKRIALPNSQYSRERVMREVKALAKLDHHNIVRYFNSWLECPPAGWQEEHDRQWCNHNKFPNSDFVSESSAVDTSVRIDVPPSETPSVNSACEALEHNKDDDEEDDSFIVFNATTDEESDDSDDEAEETESKNQNSESVRVSIENSKEHQSNDEDDSIVFEESKHSKLAERKSQLNLDLRTRKNSGRSNTKMFLYIQMQLCQRLSLREWLKTQNSQRDIFKILNIFQQIVDAVEYVHLQGLIHRDLKPSNIFFAFDDKIKIGDFGLVTAMTEGINGVHTPCNTNEMNNIKNVHTARVGTHLYMSPEQMNGKHYNYKVDIYSLGIILFELLIPFSTEMERVKALTNLRKSVFPDNFSLQYPAEYALLKMMLDDNPEKRPTTLGIKARPPFLKNEIPNGLKSENDSKWHFELPHMSRHSSITNSSGTDSSDQVC